MMVQMEQGRLEEELLTLLVDGEESVGGLAGALVELEIDPATPMRIVSAALDRLRAAGLVQVGYWSDDSKVGQFPVEATAETLTSERARYPTVADAAREDWPFIGLWYRLTPAGREHWTDVIGNPRSRSRQWTLEDRPAEGGLIVQAADEETANAAIREWNRANPSRVVTEPQRIEVGVSFSMRDGTRVENGVRWTFSQRL